MKNNSFLFVAMFMLLGQGHAMDKKEKSPAPQMTEGHASVYKPWSRATNGRSGAIFLTLNSPTKIALVQATSPVAKTVELHTHIKKGNVMKMRAVKKFDVTPAKATILQPGGDHIMLIGLHKPLKEGDEIPLELTFDNGAIINITVPVRKAGAVKPCGCAGK